MEVIMVKINVNDEIQNRTIRHAVFLERYKSGETKKIRAVLNSTILPEIRAKIEKRLEKIIQRGSDLGPETTARLKELEREVTKLADEMALKVKVVITADTLDLTRDEIDWQANAIKESLGFDLDLVVPAARSVAKIAKSTSFAGSTLNQWFDSLSRSTQRGIMTAVNRGIVEGETTEQIIRRIRGSKALNYTDGVFETTRRQAETVARSTINHVTNQARLELFKENEDIIAGLKWTATLDSRTSLTCAGLDGKTFPLDKGPRPPAHPNCRSTMTAVLKDWESLGLKNLDEGQRASINGQVPASTTYGEWLRGQPEAVQREVLGKTRMKLFNAGKLDISRFTSEGLEPLNLSQLATLEKTAFKKAGVQL
jgi:SPP1 gp7 family putative phage head morphogenesis protein